jgi:hypothetical protein
VTTFHRCPQTRANGDQCERESPHGGSPGHDYNFETSPFHNNSLQIYVWDGTGKSPFSHSN